MGKPLLFISAGDPSGDNAVSHLITALKSMVPDVSFFGLGGPKLHQLGQEQLAESRDLAVLGFWEVAQKYLFFRRLFFHCLEQIKKRRPALVLLVDYPGFNLRLAEKIKPLGIPVVYYISPQVWAWGKGRLKEINNLVDLMMYILPFERELYAENKVKSHFVGHYLLDDIPSAYIRSSLSPENRLALLPGSRPQEIDRMLRPMLQAVAILRKKYDITAVIAGIRGRYDYEKATRGLADKVRITYDNARQVIHESRLVLSSSGTATLETGIIGRPMVVVYKTGFVTYHIARRLVRLKMIGLVNLVLNDKAVPELIQHRATPEMMAAELEKFLLDTQYTERVKAKLDRLPAVLGGTGASRRAAALIREYL